MRDATKKAATTDEKIDALKPGRSIELTRVRNTRVIAERTGDGKRLRIVREYLEGHELAGERVLGYDIVLDQVW
ncbi:MAG: hypothetical protein LAO51_10545 [Acidobacteriia bacterium]|nr:hypothetical protein [Terriglobia bacterium]